MPAEPFLPPRPVPAEPVGARAPSSAATGHRPAVLASAVEVLLVPAAEASRICGISEASWYRLKAGGKTPLPVRLGGRVLWRVEELRRWCAAGCPDRRSWEALQSAQRNGRPC